MKRGAKARRLPAHLLTLVFLIGAVGACKSSSDSSGGAAGDQGAAQAADTGGGQGAGQDTAASSCGAQSIVELTTSDGVTLLADFLPAATADRGAVVLFHQNPAGFNRDSYPQRVLDAISAAGVNVLNVDRRGTDGRSGGEARDAHTGVGGRLDMEAAVGFLVSPERICAVDASKLLLVGASNGTTSVLDYTVGRADDALPDPVALIWLSPGTYSENQHAISDHREVLDVLPLLWIFPDDEPFALDFEAGAPASWRFVQLEDGMHGTGNFDGGTLEERQLGEMIAWVEAYAAE